MMFLCLNCATINNSDLLICKNCGTRVNIDYYNNLTRFCNWTAYYGYIYRKNYEEQINTNGEIRIKYSLLQPDSWLEWIAAAALTSLVGESAKLVIKHIITQVQLLTDFDAKRNYSTLLEQLSSSDKEIDNFIKYAKDYYNDMEDTNEEVKRAIYEEYLADTASNNLDETSVFLEKVAESNFKDEQQYQDYMNKVIEIFKQKRPRKPIQSDLSNFFNRIEKPKQE